MARINLLPWRAERRKLRQKEFLTMVGFAAVAAIAIAFLISSYYGAQISGQNERNQFLRDQIKQVDKQIDIAIEAIGSKQMSAAEAMKRAQ